jgi:excisionase family DNA binding protein
VTIFGHNLVTIVFCKSAEQWPILCASLFNAKKEMGSMLNKKIKWLTTATVSDYLCCSKRAIYKLVKNGKIPHSTRMGYPRFNVEDIDKWMKEKEHYYDPSKVFSQ